MECKQSHEDLEYSVWISSVIWCPKDVIQSQQTKPKLTMDKLCTVGIMIRQLVTVSVGGSHGMGHLVKLHQYMLPLNFRRAQLTNNRIKCGITTGVLQAVTFLEGML